MRSFFLNSYLKVHSVGRSRREGPTSLLPRPASTPIQAADTPSDRRRRVRSRRLSRILHLPKSMVGITLTAELLGVSGGHGSMVGYNKRFSAMNGRNANLTCLADMQAAAALDLEATRGSETRNVGSDRLDEYRMYRLDGSDLDSRDSFWLSSSRILLWQPKRSGPSYGTEACRISFWCRQAESRKRIRASTYTVPPQSLFFVSPAGAPPLPTDNVFEREEAPT